MALTLLLLAGCSGRPTDSRLLSLNTGLVETAPGEALDSLKVIDPGSLSEADRHFFDFLTVKARDKAFITHASDSLILDVVSYAASHKSAGYYPEALYYAARVYSDMGDLPTSLRYYQEALDQLPDNTHKLSLKKRILGNMAWTLNKLLLNKEACKYIIANIEIEEEQRDTLNAIYDFQLLGHTYMQAKDYDSADSILRKVMRLEEVYGLDIVTSKRYLAEVMHETGRHDSALSLVRGLPEKADSLARNGALATAAEIYLSNDKLDSAYMYAQQLIHSADNSNKETGYYVLLDPKMKGYLPSDSLYLYVGLYRDIIHDNHDAKVLAVAANQTNLYNYNLHDRERLDAEEGKNRILRWLLVTVPFLLLAIAYIFYLSFHHNKSILGLQQMLKAFMDREEHHKVSTDDSASPMEEDMTAGETPDPIREETLKRLMATAKKNGKKRPVDSYIIHSTAYARLLEMVENTQILKDDDPLWKELETVVSIVSPDFRQTLEILLAGKFKEADFQLALLIKCGIRPVQMQTLFAKSNGAIISRRDNLGAKIFGSKVSAEEVTAIITAI